jgi:VIT1/CCC1 family predicted Fe2+/Mn2+ transporter
MNPLNVTIEFLGWYGAAAILSAYAFVSLGWLGAGNLTVIALNLTGAFGLMLSSYHKKDWQPMALNVVWLAVAFVTLSRYFWVWGT